MPLLDYQIQDFMGIDQSTSENKLKPGYSPDAQNMDTENGDLAVARGFVKHLATVIPTTDRIRRMYIWHTVAEDKFVVVAGSKIYKYVPANGQTPASWATIYTYSETITSNQWDFEEARIGSTDYLLIANGQSELVKWDGTNSAEAFGSGAYVYEGVLAAVTYNMSKATSVSESTADTTLTWTLTMPAGWAYSANQEIAFTVPSNIADAITQAKVVAGGNTHTLTYVPAWNTGDIGVVKLTSTTAGEVSETAYGISAVTLGTAIGEDWVQRCKDVGLEVKGTSYAVSAVDVARTGVTFTEVCEDALAPADAAKVRGGVSDAPVNFIEIHMSRLFAAGDASYPSRLYWSQPPGDVRSIEDWSEDEASDLTSGGHTEIGNTTSDPIVGLCSLSNQLLIFKETSIYRLLGDRPSNFRVIPVNMDVEKMTNTARVSHGDTPYWLTRAGLFYHDGQNAHLSGTAKQIRNLLADANLDNCKSCENRDRLYFTLRRGTGTYDDSTIIFDLSQGTYMLRNGFNVIDICARDGVVYMINDQRYVYRFDEGSSYDGANIEAYWRTPLTDMGQKSKTKQLRALYCRGEGTNVVVGLKAGLHTTFLKFLMPENPEEVKRVDLRNEARAISLTIKNEAGSYFRLTGGVEIIYNTKEDFG